MSTHAGRRPKTEHVILGVNGLRLVGARTGVARCIEAMLRCMGELEHPFDEIRVYSPAPLDADVVLPPCARNVVLPSSLPPALWEQWVLPRAHGRRHLLLCPSYIVPILAPGPTFLIHHGSYEGYPQAFSAWQLNKARVAYAWSARRATTISTVSEHSRRDMARFYHLAAEKIEVIPEGVDTKVFRPLNDAARLAAWRRSVFGDDLPFIVYVGKPTRRRNLAALISAFARFKKDGAPHKLLLVGTDLPGDSPFRATIETLGIESEVTTRGYADHQEMPMIYNAASLLVYPSSYEGFGMPVLEAMSCGTPVIALNNSAFPEFAGGVARLLDDARVETLHEGMAAVLEDAALQKRMSQLGPQRAADYDWRIITKRYIELMRRTVAA